MVGPFQTTQVADLVAERIKNGIEFFDAVTAVMRRLEIPRYAWRKWFSAIGTELAKRKKAKQAGHHEPVCDLK